MAGSCPIVLATNIQAGLGWLRRTQPGQQIPARRKPPTRTRTQLGTKISRLLRLDASLHVLLRHPGEDLPLLGACELVGWKLDAMHHRRICRPDACLEAMRVRVNGALDFAVADRYGFGVELHDRERVGRKVLLPNKPEMPAVDV